MIVSLEIDLGSKAGELQALCAKNGQTLNELIEGLLATVTHDLDHIAFNENDELNTFIGDGHRIGESK